MNLKPIFLLSFLCLVIPLSAQEIGYTELFDMLANARTEEFKRHLDSQGFEMISKEAIKNSASRMYTYAYNYNMETKYADIWVQWEIYSESRNSYIYL